MKNILLKSEIEKEKSNSSWRIEILEHTEFDSAYTSTDKQLI